MSSTVIIKMLSHQTNFTVSENEISQFVVKNTDFVIENTISDLAKKIGVSEASINRFCKKIGYQGLSSFKVALAQSEFQEELYHESNHFSNELEAVSSSYRQLLISASSTLDYDLLLKTANRIIEANSIYLVSDLNSSFIARECEHKLSMIGFNVHAYNDTTKIQLTLQNLKKQDLIIVMTPSLFSQDIYPYLVAAKTKGIEIVAITSTDSNKLSDIVDIKIVTPDVNASKHPLILSNSFLFGFTFDVIYDILLKNNKVLRQLKLNSDATINKQLQINPFFYEY